MFNITIKNEVKIVIETLNKSGFEAYIVGGCVRDVLLNKKPKDWDVTTNAKPDEMLKVFKRFKVIPTGLQHGTITVVIKGCPIEVTTFRIDGEYKDSRRPENVIFISELKGDLSRRDFTINAMAYSDSKHLIDYFQGKDDLQRKIIRCVGNSFDRFSEDALRMMRAIRFCAQLDFALDDSVYGSINKLKHTIKNISAERVREEFVKVLDSDFPQKITLFHQTGLLEYIMPELDIFIREERESYEDLLIILGLLKSLKNHIYLKFSILFAQISKIIMTKDFEKIGSMITNELENNQASCTNSSIIAVSILKRMKFDNFTIAKVKVLIENYDINIGENKYAIKIILNKFDKDIFRDLLVIKESFWGFNKEQQQIIKNIHMIFEDIITNNECYNKRDLQLNGCDLIKLGIPQGKLLGEIIDKLVFMVIENPNLNERNVLIDIVKKDYLGSTQKANP